MFSPSGREILACRREDATNDAGEGAIVGGGLRADPFVDGDGRVKGERHSSCCGGRQSGSERPLPRPVERPL